ncbi:hypothetical protein [Nocardia sp. NPDC050793]|uniref:hypothetical protein n=1 Tax=Nocardia sp. NPDC050793 TaxID=3155159 RepID=UPI0033C27DE4
MKSQGALDRPCSQQRVAEYAATSVFPTGCTDGTAVRVLIPFVAERRRDLVRILSRPGTLLWS